MSLQLLQTVKTHLIDYGGFLAGYSALYYTWRDSSLRGDGNVVVFRMTGSTGIITRHVQFLDVSVLLLVRPANVTTADAELRRILEFLRDDFEAMDSFNITPLGSYAGPTFLQNNRALFEMILRCGVTDH